MIDLYSNDKPFNELDEESKKALVLAFVNGDVLIEVEYVEADYTKTKRFIRAVTVGGDFVYRIKRPRPTKDSIDWSHVHPDFKWMARDCDGPVLLFSCRPCKGLNGEWIPHDLNSMCAHASAFASYKRGTCDWKDSLAERPEDV